MTTNVLSVKEKQADPEKNYELKLKIIKIENFNTSIMQNLLNILEF